MRGARDASPKGPAARISRAQTPVEGRAEDGQGCSVGLDEELDRIYGLPLREFTGERNRLADELRRRGEEEPARVVKRLKKPNVPAWAVNQLARRHRQALGELFALSERLEKAQDARELRAAAEARRRLTGDLLAEARVLLAEAGHPPSPDTMQRVWRTLLAGGNREDRDAILRGRLTTELAPSGFEQGLGVQPEPEPAGPTAGEEKRRRGVEKSEREAAAAEAEADRLEELAEAARRAAERAAREAESAASEAALARRRAIRARERAERAAERMS